MRAVAAFELPSLKSLCSLDSQPLPLCAALRTDEGALTGESETVTKIVESVPEEARIQEKVNMLFSVQCIAPFSAFSALRPGLSRSYSIRLPTCSGHNRG